MSKAQMGAANARSGEMAHNFCITMLLN